MSKDIFVFIECKDGVVRKASFELLSKAGEIAGNISSDSYAVLIGNNVKQTAEELKAYADKIIVVDKEILQEYRWDTYTQVMEYLVKKYNPKMVFGASTATGKDLFPRLAGNTHSLRCNRH
jgi:electron transfer flavoprotein alpha subunit